MQKNTDMRQHSHHQIRAVEFTGGFLTGVRIEFDKGLNCIIGGRGTGKTTVLEAMRFVFDQMPDPNRDQSRHNTVSKMLRQNIGDSCVKVEVMTTHGESYSVSRELDADPVVVTGEGRPSRASIGKGIVFDVDIYSQSQIEDIANDPLFQLNLIDRFTQTEIHDLSRQSDEIKRLLKVNAAKILETRKSTDDLAEATRELPDITERLRGIDSIDESDEDKAFRAEYTHKDLRQRESLATEQLGACRS